MKIITYIVLLSSSYLIQASQPEWQFYVPSEAAEISGVYVDHNEALLISRIDNLSPQVSSFDFNDNLQFNISNNSGINALEFFPQSQSYRIYLSLDISGDDYQSGDVVYCLNNGVNCFTSVSILDDMQIPKNIKINSIDIDAISHNLVVSFDNNFEYDNQFINKCKNYNLYNENNANPIVLIEKTLPLMPFESDQCNITSFSSFNLFSDTYFVSTDNFYINSSTGISPSEVLGYESSPPGASFQNIYTDELNQKVQSIIAYSALDTGWLEIDNNTLQVNENSNGFNVDINRIDGDDFFIQVVVEASDGTAIEGTDYSFSPTTAEWNNQDSDSKTISVNLINNSSMDGNRSFSLHLFSGSMFSLVNPTKSILTVTIIDDETSDLIFDNGFE